MFRKIVCVLVLIGFGAAAVLAFISIDPRSADSAPQSRYEQNQVTGVVDRVGIGHINGYTEYSLTIKGRKGAIYSGFVHDYCGASQGLAKANRWLPLVREGDRVSLTWVRDQYDEQCIMKISILPSLRKTGND